jgi:hypothetical protein
VPFALSRRIPPQAEERISTVPVLVIRVCQSFAFLIRGRNSKRRFSRVEKPFRKLSEPLQIGPVELKNRIVIDPLNNNYAHGSFMTDVSI